MKSRITTVFLLLLLIVASFVVGDLLLASPRGTTGPAAGGGGVGPGNGQGKLHQPELLVSVRMILQQYVLGSQTYSSPPDYMYGPVAGLPVLITRLQVAQPRPNLVRTNSTGEAAFLGTVGTYGVGISAKTFSVDLETNLTQAKTTVVRVSVRPLQTQVQSLKIESMDTPVSVEPTSYLYASLGGLPPGLDVGTFVQVYGYQVVSVPGGITISGSNATNWIQGSTNLLLGPLPALNTTVVGEYGGSSGQWVILRPTVEEAPVPPIVMAGISLVVYNPTFTVSQYGG